MRKSMLGLILTIVAGLIGICLGATITVCRADTPI